MFWQRIFTLQIKMYQRRQKVTQITTQKVPRDTAVFKHAQLGGTAGHTRSPS